MENIKKLIGSNLLTKFLYNAVEVLPVQYIVPALLNEIKTLMPLTDICRTMSDNYLQHSRIGESFHNRVNLSLYDSEDDHLVELPQIERDSINELNVMLSPGDMEYCLQLTYLHPYLRSNVGLPTRSSTGSPEEAEVTPSGAQLTPVSDELLSLLYQSLPLGTGLAHLESFDVFSNGHSCYSTTADPKIYYPLLPGQFVDLDSNIILEWMWLSDVTPHTFTSLLGRVATRCRDIGYRSVGSNIVTEGIRPYVAVRCVNANELQVVNVYRPCDDIEALFHVYAPASTIPKVYVPGLLQPLTAHRLALGSSVKSGVFVLYTCDLVQLLVCVYDMDCEYTGTEYVEVLLSRLYGKLFFSVLDTH